MWGFKPHFSSANAIAASIPAKEANDEHTFAARVRSGEGKTKILLGGFLQTRQDAEP